MRRTYFALAAALWLWSGVVSAAAEETAAAEEVVEEEDFVVKTTDDLLDVCSTTPDDRLHTAAANFCQGYVVGVYHFQAALTGKKGANQLICPPNPPPSRNQAIQEFVAWGRAHPEYANEKPVEALFKFLVEKWPCT